MIFFIMSWYKKSPNIKLDENLLLIKLYEWRPSFSFTSKLEPPIYKLY